MSSLPTFTSKRLYATSSKGLLTTTQSRSDNKWFEFDPSVNQLSKLRVITDMLDESHKELLKCYNEISIEEKISLKHDKFIRVVKYDEKQYNNFMDQLETLESILDYVFNGVILIQHQSLIWLITGVVC